MIKSAHRRSVARWPGDFWGYPGVRNSDTNLSEVMEAVDILIPMVVGTDMVLFAVAFACWLCHWE